ncbi:uncharacterized protein ISCGN_016914 [Ixodes scapularis]
MAGSEIFTCEVDTENCVENIDVLRVALSSDGDAYQWLESYRQATDTSWIVDWELPNPTRVVFHKKWRCQHSNLNKTVGSRSTDCPAFVDIKIKKVTKDTKKRDPFLKRVLPLPAVIRLREEHNHVLNCADGLRFLRSTPDTRACFYNYFKDGLTPAEAIALHAQKLAAQEHTAELLASGAVNPCGNTVYHWFRVWRKNAFGGDAVDPLMKLAEKEPTYLKQGHGELLFSEELRKRVVFHKKWRCQHSNLNKTVGSRSTDCPAFVDIKIKKVTKDTKKRDPFLKRVLPLPAVIRLREEHNHVLNCADGLRFLRSTPDTRACFYNYFKDGLTPAEAIALHAQKLAAQEHTAELLASGAVNPCGNTVYHWFRVWRKNAFGGDAVDPLMKLAEKEPTYLKQGVDVKTTKSEDGTYWAVLVVTPIMRRTQGLDTARQIVFLDSTASCDESQSTVTVNLTATPAGAIPLAVLLHSSQSTESYTAAFRLLKQNYPLCFGGAHPTSTEGTSGHTPSTSVNESGTKGRRFAVNDALNAVNADDLHLFSKYELVEELRSRHLPCSGPKKQLIRRLLDDNANQRGAKGTVETLTSVIETRNEQQARIEELSTGNDKLQADVERLQAEMQRLIQAVSLTKASDVPKDVATAPSNGPTVQRLEPSDIPARPTPTQSNVIIPEAPHTFMSDNSAAEKAALQATWPEANQLLCHFHVAQAEWRWLQAARNNVSRDERRELMIAFQKIMYATSPEELNCAIEELRQMPHRGYVARVEAFLERKTEWVLLFRLAITTRSHNTKNFAEATIRILKDVVLCRRKAYNAVALVDLVASVWEGYFERRLLTHANNRVSSHKLLYNKLLQRMPEGAAQTVQALGNNVYQVPSGREDDKVYQVFPDIGACTCRAGQQGAFCKHQALIHNIYGGAFPNAPPLTPQDRHQLGLLALGDKCPEANFFRDFTDTLKEQPSSSTGGDKQAPPQLLPQLDQQMETV